LGKYLRIWLLVGLVLCGLSGCGDPAAKQVPQTTAANQYFNLSGFLQEQIRLLNQEQPIATKQVTEAGSSDPEIKKITHLDYADELGVFMELDLNKPAFRNAYTVTRQQNAQTGATTLTYRQKPGTDGNIQYLVIQTDAGGQVQVIRGLQVTNNLLLSTRRELQLHCQTRNGRNRIAAYRIQGLQKPVIFPELRYVIATQLG
jgi:hypothetical protein